MNANDADMTITATRLFRDSVAASVDVRNSLVCVGLDPDLDRFPASLRSGDSAASAIVEFNRQIIAATSDFACAFKPNLAFYMQYGSEGYRALLETRAFVPNDIPVILDCKIGDISTTMEPFARGYLDNAGFDAITVNPYLGSESLAPIFQREGKGAFVLCKTSNPGSDEVQNLELAGGRPLYLEIARRVGEWNTHAAASLGLVVGATYPAELRAVRAIAPDLLILMPGVGSQAGDLTAAVTAGIDSQGSGLLVNASRSLCYASNGPDFAREAGRAARKLRDEINEIRA